MQFDSGYSGYYHPPLYPPPYPYGWAPIPVPQYASYAPPSQQPLHFEEFYEASYRSNTYQPFPQLNMVRDPYYAAIPQYLPPPRPYEPGRENVPPARGSTREVSNTLPAANEQRPHSYKPHYAPSYVQKGCAPSRGLPKALIKTTGALSMHPIKSEPSYGHSPAAVTPARDDVSAVHNAADASHAHPIKYEPGHEQDEKDPLAVACAPSDYISDALRVAGSSHRREAATKKILARMPRQPMVKSYIAPLSKSSDTRKQHPRWAIQEAILKNPPPFKPKSKGKGPRKVSENTMLKKWVKKRETRSRYPASTRWQGVRPKNRIKRGRTHRPQPTLYRCLLKYKAERAINDKCKELGLWRPCRPIRIRLAGDGFESFAGPFPFNKKGRVPLGPSGLREVYTAVKEECDD